MIKFTLFRERDLNSAGCGGTVKFTFILTRGKLEEGRSYDAFAVSFTRRVTREECYRVA